MRTKPGNIVDELAAVEIRQALVGKRCWYAFLGIGCTFAMDFGRKVRREAGAVRAMERARSRAAKDGRRESWHPNAYVTHTGESRLLAWCSWRIDGQEGPLASSDNQPEVCKSAVKRLVGQTVRQVSFSKGWGMQLTLSSALAVNVFPNHVGPDADFSGNWELWRQDQAYLIGTDLACKVIDRENRRLRPQPRQDRWQVAAKVQTRK